MIQRDQEQVRSGVTDQRHTTVPAPAAPPQRKITPHQLPAELRRLVALRSDSSDQNRAMMTAARLVHSTNRVRTFAAVLLSLLVCAVIALAFLPWQQSARGGGRVVAYKPGERQQEITSPQKGVVASVPDALAEGAFVEKGQLLLEIKPIAADLDVQLEGQLANLQAKLETARIKAEAYGENVLAYQSARESALLAARRGIEAAEAELAAKREALKGYEAEALQARLDWERQRKLTAEGIQAGRNMEKITSDRDAKAAKVQSGLQDIEMAQAKVAEKQAELEQKQAEAQAKVDKARAEQQAAMGEMATAQKEISDLQIKQSELDRLEIRAPRDGYIQRLPVFTGGQVVKEGDYLLTFVPKTDNHAVEMWIRGNDMPLVHTGDHVRLQFEGWPALQFSGWPSVAVGTFGGEVALVDPSDDGTGRFRVMIRPAPDEVWPDDAYLRQGVRANGWIMLGRVSLAYEIWRQLNGFPPVLPEGQKLQGSKDAGPKKPKLPK
jgi:multidrug resistance efflux pump